jgi:hypothetical protein
MVMAIFGLEGFISKGIKKQTSKPKIQNDILAGCGKSPSSSWRGVLRSAGRRSNLISY